jgi:hypothetical protein
MPARGCVARVARRHEKVLAPAQHRELDVEVVMRVAVVGDAREEADRRERDGRVREEQDDDEHGDQRAPIAERRDLAKGADAPAQRRNCQRHGQQKRRGHDPDRQHRVECEAAVEQAEAVRRLHLH